VFESIIMKRTHLSALSGDVLDQMKTLHAQSNKLLQCSLPSYINNTEQLKESALRDRDVIEKLLKLQLSLKDISLELEEYFISE